MTKFKAFRLTKVDLKMPISTYLNAYVDVLFFLKYFTHNMLLVLKPFFSSGFLLFICDSILKEQGQKSYFYVLSCNNGAFTQHEIINTIFSQRDGLSAKVNDNILWQ